MSNIPTNSLSSLLQTFINGEEEEELVAIVCRCVDIHTLKLKVIYGVDTWFVMAFLVLCTCRKLFSLSSSLSRTPSKNQLLTSRLSHLLNKGVRTLHTGYIYSSSSESSDGSDDPKTNDDEGSLDEVDLGSLSRAIATISIPDTLPEVPLLVLNRNPMFPRFVKMVERVIGSDH
uniref:Lon N-terminal domain-containing protein n=1 Tax=Amphimedon queenslandica TaxID=400682 RepID=A0A1X7TR28_AMPQE